nr:MAG TPA: hypothetical protein [Caudoviricetes sp.]
MKNVSLQLSFAKRIISICERISFCYIIFKRLCVLDALLFKKVVFFSNYSK